MVKGIYCFCRRPCWDSQQLYRSSQLHALIHPDHTIYHLRQIFSFLLGDLEWGVSCALFLFTFLLHKGHNEKKHFGTKNHPLFYFSNCL